MISIGSRFLQDIRDMALDFRPPRGLFVLILTAVSPCLHVCGALECSQVAFQCEKVVRSYHTGVYVPSTDFRAKFCNTWVWQYNKNFNKTDEWWENILEYYAVVPEVEQEKVRDMSILDEGWAALPMSSP